MQKLYLTFECTRCCAPVREIASTPVDISLTNAIKTDATDYFPIIYNDDNDDNDNDDIFIVATYSTLVGGSLCDAGERNNVLILVEMKENIPYSSSNMFRTNNVSCIIYTT